MGDFGKMLGMLWGYTVYTDINDNHIICLKYVVYVICLQCFCFLRHMFGRLFKDMFEMFGGLGDDISRKTRDPNVNPPLAPLSTSLFAVSSDRCCYSFETDLLRVD